MIENNNDYHISSSISSEYDDDDVLEELEDSNTSYSDIINNVLPYPNVYERRNHKYFENTYNTINDLLSKIISHCTALNKSDSTDPNNSTDPSIIGPTDQKDNSFVNSNIKSLNKMDQQQDSKKNTSTSKCIKEAEEAAAAAAMSMLRPHSASESSTTGTAGIGPVTAVETKASAAAVEGEQSALLDINNLQTPQTLGEALEMLNKLQAMKDSLLEERERNDKFVSRYKEKVDKAERMATLHSLVPRELFLRSDAYENELNKVYKWKNVSDKDIAEIYQAKLKKAGLKQHGASTSSSVAVVTSKKDPYAGFREVPDFTKVDGEKSPHLNSSTTSSNNIMRNLTFMRKIGINAD